MSRPFLDEHGLTDLLLPPADPQQRRQDRPHQQDQLFFCCASKWRASSALIRPSWLASSARKSSALPRNSPGDRSPSLLRSDLVNHTGSGLEGRLDFGGAYTFGPSPSEICIRRGTSDLDSVLSAADASGCTLVQAVPSSRADSRVSW